MPYIIAPVICLMKKEVLANAGEQVKVVSDYGNVMIVELKGNRFSVRKENLTTEKREGEVIVPEVKEAKRSIKKVRAGKPELF